MHPLIEVGLAYVVFGTCVVLLSPFLLLLRIGKKHQSSRPATAPRSATAQTPSTSKSTHFTKWQYTKAVSTSSQAAL
ncbi:uncharacterized protein LY89DRAFT_684790 [Mollisia scopiformis]|uniref:Uncharacterized protein n=1 Tax=Mollisia scopiformis TaxID=149040 RepID=A0A194X958_MOLSC|nr:uncharacterized protein LY89DRAFT_684790 [Mollisia scopiformis]KUJ16700.1 hypothetical protein LY89DRAFT_684790 [Mollisia scopiformis]